MKTPNANPIRRITFEPSDNGGFISKTERAATPPGKKAPYLDYDDRTSTAVHPSVQHAAAHLVGAFPGKKGFPKKKGPGIPSVPSAAGAISSKMLSDEV